MNIETKQKMTEAQRTIEKLDKVIGDLRSEYAVCEKRRVELFREKRRSPQAPRSDQEGAARRPLCGTQRAAV